MRCITRKQMTFGGLVIPARTECRVINHLDTLTVDAPGVHLSLQILFRELGQRSILADDGGSRWSGYVITTATDQVYMDAGDRFYVSKMLYPWRLVRMFGGEPPSAIKHAEDGKYRLPDLIEHLDEMFNAWVDKNCEFRQVTHEDIESGEAFDGADIGDRILSDLGMAQFASKKLEIQRKLEEATGFTYDFRGGLIWE